MYSSRFSNIDQIIKLYSKQNPNKICLIYENIDVGYSEQLTYKEFDKYISKASNFLIAEKLKLKSKLMISLPNSLVHLIFLFACFRSGIIAVTVNPNLTDRELKYQFSKSKSDLIISIDDKSQITKNNILLNDISLNYLDDLLDRFDSTYPEIKLKGEDDASILFTSGTTNLPKGVISTQYSYLNKISNVTSHLEMNSEDRHYLTLPIFHTNGQYSLLAIMSVGGSALITSKFSTSNYFKLARKHKATLSTLFASTIRMLLMYKKSKLDKEHSIRLIMYAQSVSQLELDEWNSKFNINIIQIYGMSETTGMISANPLINNRNLSMGKVLPMYDYKILNNQKKSTKPYEIGELLVKGEKGISFMKGYIDDYEATNDVIKNNYLHTGDMVYKDDDDYIYFVDRKNDVIKRSGENISTVEIENVLINCKHVKNVSVVGIPDKIMDYTIVAFIIPNDTNIDINDIKEFCRINLIPYKIPEKFLVVDTFPTTSVGKIQKYKLIEEYL